MGVTLSSTLDAIEQEVWTDLYFQGLTRKPILTSMATTHDLRGANSDVVNFPVIGAIAATKLAEGVSTTFTSLAPSATNATAYEIQAAVEVTRFAQATRPVKTVLTMVNSLMAALANQSEADLVSEASSGPVDNVGTTTVDLDLATMLQARNVLGAYQELLGGFVLNPTGEQTLIQDANLSQAAQYGNSSVIQDGQIARLYGGPVFVSPYCPTNHSVMVAKDTMHLGVVASPSYDVQWDSDKRADLLVATCIIAVKYVPTDIAKGADILHV